jgi:tellurite resistance protein TerC
MDTYPLWAWAGFLVFIVCMLALDLGVFRKNSHEVKMKEALTWCGVWFALALGFCSLVLWQHGKVPAQEWLASYLVEMCLSVDNVFVFIVIFSFFKVAPAHQHRVLFWGIVGAAAMRAVFILAGVELLERFHWIIYIFGVFLLFTGIKMALPKKADDEFDPEKNWAVRLFHKFYPVSRHYDEGKFFTVVNGVKMATPLFIVLIVIETTDVAFALDSIPAVLAITKSGFIAFTSNIFAILGLRSLYFALSGVMGLFRFLGLGLAVILSFIGVKMLITTPWLNDGHGYHISTGTSLAVIGVTLTLSVLASIIFKEKVAEKLPAPR